MNIEEAIDKVDRFVNTITVILPKYSTAIPEYCIDEESWIAIKKVLTAYEKEKEKNKELTERVLKLESDKFWDNVVSKSKIKEIIYPTPENEIPIEIHQSEMYKKLLKEVEE